MTGLNTTLNTAGSALSAQQSAISVTSQNIANVDNPDYSLQTAECSASTPVESSGITYGTGVQVDGVNQNVNQQVENHLTREKSAQAALETQLLYMKTIEDIFDESTGTGLNAAMDSYWNAWEDLSNDPANPALQAMVYDQGTVLSQQFNAIDAQLEQMTHDLNREIRSDVQEVNAVTAEIAALNQEILAAEAAGNNANDLKDQRNALVDDLGEL
ncbi:MAG: flagellar hook-associated protein FlgK, partial [Desulfobacterales bacterium]|nr:flagellar hook-associated protein FlgK [Desulfobacterales bacterium]